MRGIRAAVAVAIASLDEALERRWRGKVRRGLALHLSKRAETKKRSCFLKWGSLPWMSSREAMRATAHGCSWSVEGVEVGSS